MSNVVRSFSWAALVGCFFSAVSVEGANRFYVEDQTLLTGSTDNVIPILVDLDEDAYALSVYVEFNSSLLTVTAVELGSDVTGLDPEYENGILSNNPGQVTHGFLFDLSDPITKHLQAGVGREVLRLVVDVDASSSTTTTIDFKNVNGAPNRLNVLADVNGDPISPTPTLDDGLLTLSDLKPIIDTISPATGEPDDLITISGQNFDQADLTVSIGGRNAEFTPAGNDLVVTVPACPTADAIGPADVEVCTVRGCTVETNGFNYESCGPVPPLIQLLVNNSGMAGKDFFVSGLNFDENGLVVRVCGVVADFELSGADLVVTAPECATEGWAEIEICTDIGCDSEPQGFFYEPKAVPGQFLRGDVNHDGGVDVSDPIAFLNELFVGIDALAPCQDARDFNDDGGLDISDGIYGLQFLFGPGPAIPEPYPNAGVDPTPDDLDDCPEDV